MKSSPINYGYVAFIDEAGEPALSKVRPLDENGSSEWLILSAVVVRTCFEDDVPQWLDGLKIDLGLDRYGPIHFRNLSPSRRLVLAQSVASMPLRGFAICSNKKNMRQYRNPRAEKVSSQEWFYNFCVRLLLERVTAFCDRRRLIDYAGAATKIKVIFSRRGGHRYSQTKAYTRYLRHQEQAGSMVLNKRQIITDLLHTDIMEHHPHWARPGLQLADTVASAFYAAANTIGPGVWDTEPAMALSRIMAKERKSVTDFGVALQPTPPAKAQLTPEQRQIFEHYGYNFEGR